MRNICVFVGSRANYSSIKSVMRAVNDRPDLNLQLVLGASAILERFGKVQDLIEKDGFKTDAYFTNLIEGDFVSSMSKSTGLGIIEFSNILEQLKPDFLVIVGDRFEMMCGVIAAAYMNIRIVHTMGGEVTGTIDESIRHAITKFSHVHFPANKDARERILKMGEYPEYVFNVGCPRIDLVADELKEDSLKVLKAEFPQNLGVGTKIDFEKPFLLVSQHPVTTEFEESRDHMEETLKALEALEMQTILLWPNADAGSDSISKAIRTFREQKRHNWLNVHKNLPIRIYIHLMNTTGCLIGNSSSGVREGAYIGTPVVNIGTRQNSRMSGVNVLQSPPKSESILVAVRKHLDHGKYVGDFLYGDGTAGEKIAEILSQVDPKVQKIISY